MEKRMLPEYNDPPVVETVLGVQFEPLPRFKNAHLGAFWTHLGKGDWPTVSDAPLLDPQFERFDEKGRWEAIGVQIRLTQDPASRLQMKNQATDRMVQVQNGRLHFNWLGLGHSDLYPRYPNIRNGFTTTVQRFMEFVAQEDAGDFRPNQWEVTYVNHIVQETVWSTPADWEFFRPLAPIPIIENVAHGESFGGEWHFVIPDRRGRLHVHWQHGAKSLADSQELEVVRLTFTARGPVEQSDDTLSAILAGLDLGHETIVRSFEKLTSDAANEKWGLKHVND